MMVYEVKERSFETRFIFDSENKILSVSSFRRFGEKYVFMVFKSMANNFIEPCLFLYDPSFCMLEQIRQKRVVTYNPFRFTFGRVGTKLFVVGKGLLVDRISIENR